MKENNDYSEKLQAQEWQRKKEFVKNHFDNNICQICGEKQPIDPRDDEKLQLHHLAYKKCEPWEYDNRQLITLCPKCHEMEQHKMDSKIFSIIKTLGLKGVTKWEIYILLSALNDRIYKNPFAILDMMGYNKDKINEIKLIDYPQQKDGVMPRYLDKRLVNAIIKTLAMRREKASKELWEKDEEEEKARKERQCDFQDYEFGTPPPVPNEEEFNKAEFIEKQKRNGLFEEK